MKRVAILVVFLSVTPVFSEPSQPASNHGQPTVTKPSKPATEKTAAKTGSDAVAKGIDLCSKRPGTSEKR